VNTRACFAAALVAALASVAAPARADDTPARLAAQDALARAGKPVKLHAKLESKGLLGVYSSVEGEFLDFWLTGEPSKDGKPGVVVVEKERFLGSAKTDSNGAGELEWTPDEKAAGSFEVEVRVRKGSKYVVVPATLDVLIAHHERPLAVVSIEQTLTDLSVVTFMRKEARDIVAADGAAGALTTLANDRAIIYMTGIEEVSLVKTKDWLKLRGFPPGPVFFWNISTNSLSGEKYKTNLLGRLRADFGGLTAGIGGRDEDCNACLKNGITAYLVGAPDGDAPAEAVKVKAWDKLVPAVARQGEVEGLLQDLSSTDAAKQDAATKALARLETGELGYLTRFLHAPDVALAGAARLIQGRVRARDAFAASLDTSTDATTLASLIAAWRQDDATVTARLYRDGAAGLAKAGPALAPFRGIEVVNRGEPEPGKVVYRLRFLAAKDGAPNVERDYSLLRADDGTWRVDAGDL
jgi:hypothetical protein